MRKSQNRDTYINKTDINKYYGIFLLFKTINKYYSDLKFLKTLPINFEDGREIQLLSYVQEFEYACSLPCTYSTWLLGDTVILLHKEEKTLEFMFE